MHPLLTKIGTGLIGIFLVLVVLLPVVAIVAGSFDNAEWSQR